MRWVKSAAFFSSALVRERVELQRLVAGINDVPNLGHDCLVGGEPALVGVGVERDFIAHRSTEQLVDWQAEHLAAYVPERDVDGAHALAGRAPAAHIGEAAEQLVPELLDAAWVLAGDLPADLLEDGTEGTIGDPCRGGDLPPARDPLVGRHLDEQILAPIGAGGLD
jgi:hypothetical protein